MSWVDTAKIVTIPKELNDFARMAVDEGFAPNQTQVIEMAIGIGLREDLSSDPSEYEGELEDAVKVGQMDPDDVLTEAILHRYGDLAEGDRLKRVQGHAVAGLEKLREHFEAERNLNPHQIADSL